MCNASVVVDVWCIFAVGVRHCHIAATPANAIIRRVLRRRYWGVGEYDGGYLGYTTSKPNAPKRHGSAPGCPVIDPCGSSSRRTPSDCIP